VLKARRHVTFLVSALNSMVPELSSDDINTHLRFLPEVLGGRCKDAIVDHVSLAKFACCCSLICQCWRELLTVCVFVEQN
jgi:hypothetical protein